MAMVPITTAVKITNKRVAPFDGVKKYLDTGGLSGNSIKTDNVTFTSKPSRADLLVRQNQLIVARMKETDKVLLINDELNNLIVSTGFLVLEVLDGWSPDFLRHFFRSNLFQKQKDRLATGATQKAINNNNFSKILISPFPIEYQMRATKYFNQADALRQKRKQAIDLLDEYIKSIFLEMFGDPITNPKEWEMMPLINICRRLSDGPFGSKLKSEHYVEKGVRVIRLQNIGVNKFIDKDKAYISEDYYQQELHRYTCKPGDIVIATLGGPNIRACLIPNNIQVSVNKADCVHCVPNNQIVNSNYLVNLLNLPQFQHVFLNLVHGQTRGRISSGQLKKVEIPVPKMDLQNKFAKIVQDTETLKQKMLEQSGELDSQFQALMQKHFNHN